jgi:hypothetical protein
MQNKQGITVLPADMVSRFAGKDKMLYFVYFAFLN